MLLSGTTTPEYLIIQNAGDRPQDMSGWYLESTVGPQVFNFPRRFYAAGRRQRAHRKFYRRRRSSTQSLLWSTDAIWRNAGDKAILRNQSESVAQNTVCYGDACP